MTGYVLGIELSWAAWYASWIVAAWFTAPVVKRSPATVVAYVLELPGFFLLLVVAPRSMLNLPLWQPSATLGWVLFVLNLPGFAFAWWARSTLGRLWSGTITRKENHHLVDSGPYGLVRHPIYTGLMASVGVTVAAKATPIALMGGLLLVIGWTIKARLEERFLVTELGASAYEAYRARVPMLIPFGTRSGTMP